MRLARELITMNSLHAPLTQVSLETRTDPASGQSPYTVRLMLSELPVKATRKPLHHVCVELMCDGRAVEDADVAVGFHPLHAQHRQQQRVYSLSELVLAPQHRADVAGCFDGAVALQDGDYRVDVTINHQAHAAFVFEHAHDDRGSDGAAMLRRLD